MRLNSEHRGGSGDTGIPSAIPTAPTLPAGAHGLAVTLCGGKIRHGCHVQVLGSSHALSRYDRAVEKTVPRLARRKRILSAGEFDRKED